MPCGLDEDLQIKNAAMADKMSRDVVVTAQLVKDQNLQKMLICTNDEKCEVE